MGSSARVRAVLCRQEAAKLWALKDELTERGVSMIGVIHERINNDAEVRRCSAAAGPRLIRLNRMWHRA